MEVMMKELGEIITGNTPSKKTEEFWNSEDICFVKPDVIADNGVNEIVDSNEYISEEARKKARVVGKNSIFVTCIGSIGKIGIASDGEYAFNQQINAIIPNDRVQPKYLAYNLLFNKPRLVAIANAPVVPIINKSQFGEFTVNIETDIDRQCEIVDVLDKLTQIIQQRNKEISALDAIIKARFVEMFGEPVLNPFSWEMKRFDEICENLDSRRKPISSGDRVEGIYPYYGASGIVDYVEDYIFDEDILLVSEDGANLLMRSTPIAFSVSGKVWVNNHAHVVRFDKMSLQKYVEIYFSLIDISDSITGSAQPKLNQAKLNAMMIPIPEDTLLDRYCEFLYQVDKSKVAVQKALDETQVLFDSLMQKYFG